MQDVALEMEEQAFGPYFPFSVLHPESPPASGNDSPTLFCYTYTLQGPSPTSNSGVEIPVILRYYHSIPSEEFVLNRNNTRYIINDFLYAYCNPFYNLSSRNMYIGCN